MQSNEEKKVMLKDTPYSVLKKNARAYEIMLLREQEECSFADIGRKLHISPKYVRQIYHELKYKQLRLYVKHIAFTLGHESIAQIRVILNQAFDCYQDGAYVSAYFEKIYGYILTEYRAGEPGAPEKLMQTLPPFHHELSRDTVLRVVELHEADGKPYADIAKELNITQAKAKSTYDAYYCELLSELVDFLQDQARTPEERESIRSYVYGGNKSYKTRYELLKEKYSI